MIITEIWKNIIGWEQYQVSDMGRVKSLDRVIRNRLYKGQILNPDLNCNRLSCQNQSLMHIQDLKKAKIQLNAFAISIKSLDFREAPPIKPPSISA